MKNSSLALFHKQKNNNKDMLWIISLAQSTNCFCSRDDVAFEFRVGEAMALWILFTKILKDMNHAGMN